MHTHHTTKLKVAVVATALAGLLTGCRPWGPVSSSYNGHTVVKGSGYTNISPQSVSDHITVTDTLSDGNSVHGHVSFQFYKLVHDSLGDTHWEWVDVHEHSTPGFQGGTRDYNYSSGLQGDSSQARVKSFVCAQMGWPVPDSCSNSAYISYNY